MEVNKSEYQIEVISTIKLLRNQNGYSQAKLADYLGISYGLLGNIESPRYPHKYTLSQINRIANLFDVSVSWIFLKKESNNIDEILPKIIKYDS